MEGEGEDERKGERKGERKVERERGRERERWREGGGREGVWEPGGFPVHHEGCTQSNHES